MYIQSNLKNELNYYEVNTVKQLQVNLYFDNGDIQDCTAECIIEIFDTNITYNKETKELIFVKEGSAKLKILLLNTDNTYLTETIEILVYDTFFKENYLTSFFSGYDAGLIQKNERLKVIMDALMQYMDILYSYKQDIYTMTDTRNVKSKYLTSLGQTFGFEKIDFTNEDSANEAATEYVYREILLNLFDIINIRGTKLSYELFFNALGFDIKLEEFWFNNEGDLVQIDVVEDDNGDTNSTYLTYDTSGAPVLSGPELNKDPRKYNTPNNPYYIANKSNYIRPIITNRIDNVGQLASFTQDRKKIIRKYLEYLRPQHIQYLTAVLTANLSYIYDNNGVLIQDSEIITFFNTILEDFISARQYCIDNTSNYGLALEIDSIEVLDTDLINIVFNKKVKAPNSFVSPTINDITKFATTNLLTIESVRRIPDAREKIQIRFDSAVAGADTITGINISDAFGNTFTDSEAFVLPANLVGPFVLPAVVSITAISRRLIRIVFNTKLDYDSVIDLNNYSVLDNLLTIESVFLNSDLESIDLFLKDDMIHNQLYTITLSDIYNYTLLDSLTVYTANFIGFGYDDITVTNQPIMLPECGVISNEVLDAMTEKYLRASNIALGEVFGYFLKWDTPGIFWDITNIKWDQKDLAYDTLTITQV